MKNAIKGSITALITPFDNDGNLNLKSYEKFIKWQIDNKIHGLVPIGSTGESPTLSHNEHIECIKACVKVTDGAVPVIAGTGSNNTKEAIQLTKNAEKAGADAALVVTPYYNKPTQKGLYHHYKAICENTEIPIIIYNIPGRSVIDISDDTIAKLNKEYPDQIIGLKDASGDVGRTKSVLEKTNSNFFSLSGDDNLTDGFLKNGAIGCISIISNFLPDVCSKMHNFWLEGKHDDFLSMHNKLLKLQNLMFCEPNPCPVKYACYRLGIIDSDFVRLPLVTISDENKKKIDEELIKLELI